MVSRAIILRDLWVERNHNGSKYNTHNTTTNFWWWGVRLMGCKDDYSSWSTRSLGIDRRRLCSLATAYKSYSGLAEESQREEDTKGQLWIWILRRTFGATSNQSIGIVSEPNVWRHLTWLENLRCRAWRRQKLSKVMLTNYWALQTRYVTPSTPYIYVLIKGKEIIIN